MNLIASTGEWFVAANQQPADPTPDVRQASFYVGMQLEELAEKLAVLSHKDGAWLSALADGWKRGVFDAHMSVALADSGKVKELLDADVDLVWVTCGAARAAGSDLPGAYAAVGEANWAKRWEDGYFHNDPETKKVLKPLGWTAADLTQFVHPTLRAPR